MRVSSFSLILARLITSRRRLVLVEMAMLGELPYVIPILKRAHQIQRSIVVLFAARSSVFQEPEFQREFREKNISVPIVTTEVAKKLSRAVRPALWITSEQFSKVWMRPSLCVFHGQPSKGLTFSRSIIESFDHFFLLGPLQEAAYDEFLIDSCIDLTKKPKIHRIGYPKSDPIVAGTVDKESVRQRLRIDERYQCILYAPAFNEFCSLRTIGVELIETLCRIPNAIVLVKLAPDSISGPKNIYGTGGIDWKYVLSRIAFPNLRLVQDLDIGAALSVADVMVTDVSGVAYEFLAIGKPVIYFDCLDFYTNTVMKNFPGLSLEDILSRDTVNAGRRYGTVVGTLGELTQAVANARLPVSGASMQAKLLYNPGCATENCIDRINSILDGRNDR
ncbi:MAG: CDP-glycerol glycerophosphotransferase family protein [Planctomycetaceae bacterium]|nr:CDP-glycerol glycerophosphotransferase family protein [Planctomycetaceae bacterium]